MIPKSADPRVSEEVGSSALLQSEHALAGYAYQVVTFGCQMNKSDSERIAGMFDVLGAQPAACQEDADIIVFMTCCVRVAADKRLYGQVASLKNTKALLVVGGCIGQRDAQQLAKRMPHIGLIFGTHNLSNLPKLILKALKSTETVVEVISNEEALRAPHPHANMTAPIRREHPWHAWLPIMTGCNNFCSYCIVPYVRGRERSQVFEALVAQAEALVADGVQEITLIGQNVNSYGRDLYGSSRFAELLSALGTSGVSRLRFATSHPKDLLPETIEVFAQTQALMPALHLPVQSGSNTLLKAMHRKYTVEHYLDLVKQVREACEAAGKGPVALSTDIIVGFPGETAEDFEQTMTLVEQAAYAQAFTFIYSKREGTPAAQMQDDTPRELIQERFKRLVECVQQSAGHFNQQYQGSKLPVLFEGTSKRDKQMLTGRSPGNQTVHAPLPKGMRASDYEGRIVSVHIDEAKTWYLRGNVL